MSLGYANKCISFNNRKHKVTFVVTCHIHVCTSSLNFLQTWWWIHIFIEANVSLRMSTARLLWWGWKTRAGLKRIVCGPQRPIRRPIGMNKIMNQKGMTAVAIYHVQVYIRIHVHVHVSTFMFMFTIMYIYTFMYTFTFNYTFTFASYSYSRLVDSVELSGSLVSSCLRSHTHPHKHSHSHSHPICTL